MWGFCEGEETTFYLPGSTVEDQNTLQLLCMGKNKTTATYFLKVTGDLL